MANDRILVVDDEEDILELVRYNLSKEGYEVSVASTGEEALKLAHEIKPHLLVLDLMLPGLGGLEICKQIKSDPQFANISIVMLTAKGDESDVVAGLEMGADDYVVKPFSPKVLSARVKTVLRREHNGHLTSGIINVDKLSINPERHEVTVSGSKVELTHTEFKILHLLAGHPGIVFTRAQIVDQVHGEDYPVTDRSIDVQIVGLRRKITVCGDLIETVRGVGYRFKDLASP